MELRGSNTDANDSTRIKLWRGVRRVVVVVTDHNYAYFAHTRIYMVGFPKKNIDHHQIISLPLHDVYLTTLIPEP